MITPAPTGTAGARSLRHRRAMTESLLLATHLLAPDDRLMLRAHLDRGLSAADLARLRAVSPRTTQRRLRALVRHLGHPRTRGVIRARRHWPPRRRRIADAVLIRRRSYRQAARELGLSLHTIRAEVARITAQLAPPRSCSAAPHHHTRHQTPHHSTRQPFTPEPSTSQP